VLAAAWRCDFFPVRDGQWMLTTFRGMATRRKKTVEVKLKRLEAQTQVIRAFNRIVFGILGLVLGLVVVASALPQKRELENLEFELARVLEAEKAVMSEKEYRETEYLALKEDPEFLELKSMDRLNLHREGDKVYRMKRDGE
jgi:uncharacterized protein YacL